LHGVRLDVLAHTHRNGTLHLSLILPDGTRSLIPAAWTDIKGQIQDGSQVVTSDGSSPLHGSVGDLLRARKVVDALLRRLDRPEPIYESPSSEESQRATSIGVLGHGTASQHAPVGGSRGGGTDRGDCSAGPDDHQGRASQADSPGGESR